MTDEMAQQVPGGAGSAPSGLPLHGLRVIAVEHAVAGPLCSRHLGDLGADVVKVESPAGGDMSRSYDSVVHGQSAYFVWANRGKRSIVLDLKSPAGMETLGALLDDADVFVHNLAPGSVDRLGLDRESVSRRWPTLINCAISGYGSDGPYEQRRAFDLLIQGEAGLLSVTGQAREPAKVGISVADMCGGVYAVCAILAALIDRSRGRGGSFIDISLLECLAEWMMAPAYHQLYAGSQPVRAGARHNMIVPYGVYAVGASGSVNFAVQTGRQWRAFCEGVLDRPELTDDPRFATNEDRVRNRSALEALVEDSFASEHQSDVLARMLAAGIPTGDVNDLRGLVEHPQLRARARWSEAESPGGPIRTLRSPLDHRDDHERRSAVPGLGEHTEEILAELQHRAAQRRTTRNAEGRTTHGDPLRGVKALMFDFYGTVVDMQGGLTKAITPYLAQKGYTENSPTRLVTWWRRTHFENSMIDALLHREHTPYREIGREAVDYTLRRAGIDHTDQEVRDLVAEIERLDPFPDVVEALTRVKAHGLRLVILSNGDPDMLARGVPYSGTADLWDSVISANEAASFKPHRDTYSTAARIIGLEPSAVLFVANHAFDCIGAKATRMTTAFVDRRRRPFGNRRYPPDLIVADFTELADTVLQRARRPDATA